MVYVLNPFTKKLDSAGSGGAGAVDSVNTRTGAVVLTSTDVGLVNVDNTADTAKPVSTAQQTALDAKLGLHAKADTAGAADTAITLATGADRTKLDAITGMNTGDNSANSLYSSLVSSQWVTASPYLYYNSGNVGIGTTNPGGKLEIGSSSALPDIITSILKYAPSGNVINKLALYNNPSASVYGMGISGNTGFDLFSGDNGFNFLTGTTNVDGTGASSKVRITVGGNVGIGTTGPLSKLSINGGLHVGGDSDAGDNNALIDGTLGVTGAITGSNLSGTNTGDQSAIANATLATMLTKTYKGNTTAGTATPADVPIATLKTDLILVKADVGLGSVDNTADSGKPISTAGQTALNLKSNLNSPTFTGTVVFPAGQALVTPALGAATGTSLTTTGSQLSSGGGFGYTTGAGGTVIQATSRATGVTLSKLCGNITMFSAAVLTQATSSFVLTNTFIAATDTVIVYHISATNGGAWNFSVVPAAGSCTIIVRNITAASITEATPLRFAVIKGVTA